MKLTEKQTEALKIGREAAANGKSVTGALRDAGVSPNNYYGAVKKLKKHGKRGPRVKKAIKDSVNTHIDAHRRYAAKPKTDQRSKVMVVIGTVADVRHLVAEGLR